MPHPDVGTRDRLPPHIPLNAYYSSEAERRRFLGRVFDHTSRYYDWISSFLSFGTGAWYRAYALRRAGLKRGFQVLDVATGTGLVARAAVRSTGPTGMVVGLDPSVGMLSRFKGRERVRLTRGIAERLPFRDGTFDFISMGYALRHVADLASTFAEYRRVLRPGGRLLILDFARPRTTANYGAARLLLQIIVPMFTRLFAGGREAALLMRYCWDTVEHCVPPARTRAALEQAGFSVHRVSTWAGLFVEFAGFR